MNILPWHKTHAASSDSSDGDVPGADPIAVSRDKTKSPASVLVASAYLGHAARMAELLAGDGCLVSQTQSGDQALAMVRNQHFDLLVVAVHLSGMDGLELLRAVRETVPNLPVIVVADLAQEINVVYLRCAELFGAFRTHDFPLDRDDFLKSARDAIGLGWAKLSAGP